MRRPTLLVAVVALGAVLLASAAAARQTTRSDESVAKIVTPGPLNGEPEAAESLPAITNNGKTYTFTIKKGLRFSDGSAVTARNFAWAFDRVLTKTNKSPAVRLLANVEGAQAKLEGRTQHVSGVVVKGNKLIVKLTKPDGAFLAKLATPFFQATSLNVKADAAGIDAYPTAGPYYIAS